MADKKIIDIEFRARATGTEAAQAKVRAINDEVKRGNAPGAVGAGGGAQSAQRAQIEAAIASLTPEERKAGGPGVDYLKGAAKALGIEFDATKRATANAARAQAAAATQTADISRTLQMDADQLRQAHRIYADATRQGAPVAGGGGRIPPPPPGGGVGAPPPDGGSGNARNTAQQFQAATASAKDLAKVQKSGADSALRHELFMQRVQQRGLAQAGAIAFALGQVAQSMMDLDAQSSKLVRGMNSAALSMQIVGGITSGKFGAGMMGAGALLTVVAAGLGKVSEQVQKSARGLLDMRPKEEEDIDKLSGLLQRRAWEALRPGGVYSYSELDRQIDEFVTRTMAMRHTTEARDKAKAIIKSERTPDEEAAETAKEYRTLAKRLRGLSSMPGIEGQAPAMMREAKKLDELAYKKLHEIANNTRSWKDFAWEIIGGSQTTSRPVSISAMQSASPAPVTINVPGDGALAAFAASIAHQVNAAWVRRMYPWMAR